MPAELVTIAYEFSPLKANLMRTRLEADGIECFLHGETLTSVVGSLSYASASWDHPEGNIALQVFELDAMRAREILHEIESAPHDEDDENWDHIKPNRAWELLSVLVTVALIIFLTIFATMWVRGATQSWWLGAMAGAVIFAVLMFFTFKNYFKSTR